MLSLLLVLGWIVGLPDMVNADVNCEASDQTVQTDVATPEPESFPSYAFPAEGGSITIFAAASLTDAFNEMAGNLRSQHPNLTIDIETAGSQTLVTQLEEGARADVLATANISTMARAQESGLIAGEPVDFTGNRLVIVTPANNPAQIADINDLANAGVKLVLANPDVPAGAYAARAFCSYGAMVGAPEGFIAAINGNIVSEEPDVRHVLAKIQLGEADAGIVYASDATASILAGVNLQIIAFPNAVPTSASYPIAALADGNTELANAFISYVLSNEGQAVLQKYGFD